MQVIEVTRLVHIEGIEVAVLTSVPVESIDYWSEDTRRGGCGRITLKSKAQFKCVELYAELTSLIMHSGRGGRKRHPSVG